MVLAEIGTAGVISAYFFRHFTSGYSLNVSDPIDGQLVQLSYHLCVFGCGLVFWLLVLLWANLHGSGYRQADIRKVAKLAKMIAPITTLNLYGCLLAPFMKLPLLVRFLVLFQVSSNLALLLIWAILSLTTLRMNGFGHAFGDIPSRGALGDFPPRDCLIRRILKGKLRTGMFSERKQGRLRIRFSLYHEFLNYYGGDEIGGRYESIDGGGGAGGGGDRGTSGSGHGGGASGSGGGSEGGDRGRDEGEDRGASGSGHGGGASGSGGGSEGGDRGRDGGGDRGASGSGHGGGGRDDGGGGRGTNVEEEDDGGGSDGPECGGRDGPECGGRGTNTEKAFESSEIIKISITLTAQTTGTLMGFHSIPTPSSSSKVLLIVALMDQLVAYLCGVTGILLSSNKPEDSKAVKIFAHIGFVCHTLGYVLMIAMYVTMYVPWYSVLIVVLLFGVVWLILFRNGLKTRATEVWNYLKNRT